MFEVDLKKGEDNERRILAKIKRKYPNAVKIEGYHKEYDIHVPEKGMDIEVKYDEKSLYTGNYAIESRYDGKPSGITSTTAHVWVISNEYLDIWITPWMINNVIRMNGYKEITTIPEGETKSVNLYLIPTRKLQLSAEHYEIHSHNKE